MDAVSRVSEIKHPIEKLLKIGAQALLDHELIATMLGLGTKDEEAAQLAIEVVEVFDQTSTTELFKKLCEVQGIGDIGAGKILASLEFARRRSTTAGLKVSKAADLVPWISYYAVKQQEHFLAITLNGANEVISVRCVSVGLVNCTQVHPREVFVDAISDRACSIIVAHNHPSGELKPSNADIEVTKRLVEAGKILGISVLDHIILNAKGGYLSLRDEGGIWF
jgi:DNA repair protein RadC